MKPVRSAIDEDALLVAMTVVPGLYSRNRMFALYTDPRVRYAKARAVVLRGVVRHLGGAQGETEVVELARGPKGGLLRYRIGRMRLERSLELSDLEAACVVYLAGRAGSKAMRPSARDRALIDAALQRLSLGLRLYGAKPVPPSWPH